MAHHKSLLSFPPASVEASKAELLASHYASVRQQTESLAAPLSAEDQMVQSCPESSPAKWHQAHTTWFFETFILAQHLPDYRAFDGRFRDLFNSYYNAVGPQPEKASRNTFSRPSLEDVQNYRRHVDQQVQTLLASSAADDAVLKLVELGANHEQQHQELLVTDIKHAFWSNPVRPAYQSVVPAASATAPAQSARTFSGGLTEIGSDGSAFHFDNEAPRHKVFLQPFRFARRPATCGEYMAFIDDKGYQRPELWLSDGWKAVQTHRWNAPLYWEKSGNDWHQFTCSGMRKVDPSEPVCHVSFFEADAFARWAGARLPTEFEWELAASQLPVQGNFLEDARFHPNAAPGDAGDDEPLQIFGDVWEWTASAYLPFPGFRPAEGALGEYNGKFMSGQMVLRGGSCATPRSHIRASYRNFFPPETRWQFSGIRLADDSI
ncbi:MAG TPA: ergothioneine biosynthesis protein EgtB [Candidatus Limnocylindrales bacterium]|nr:ergothioneine biosynthesis protein EgtB [Candidatus Limnocylindrales bacterium]